MPKKAKKEHKQHKNQKPHLSRKPQDRATDARSASSNPDDVKYKGIDQKHTSKTQPISSTQTPRDSTEPKIIVDIDKIMPPTLEAFASSITFEIMRPPIFILPGGCLSGDEIQHYTTAEDKSIINNPFTNELTGIEGILPDTVVPLAMTQYGAVRARAEIKTNQLIDKITREIKELPVKIAQTTAELDAAKKANAELKQSLPQKKDEIKKNELKSSNSSYRSPFYAAIENILPDDLTVFINPADGISRFEGPMIGSNGALLARSDREHLVITSDGKKTHPLTGQPLRPVTPGGDYFIPHTTFQDIMDEYDKVRRLAITATTKLLQPLLDRHAELSLKLAELQPQLMQQREKNQQLSKLVSAELQQSQKELDNLQKHLAESQQKLVRNTEQTGDLQAALSATKSDLEAKKMQLAESKQEITDLQQEFKKARISAGTELTKLKKLTSDNSSYLYRYPAINNTILFAILGFCAFLSISSLSKHSSRGAASRPSTPLDTLPIYPTGIKPPSAYDDPPHPPTILDEIPPPPSIEELSEIKLSTADASNKNKPSLSPERRSSLGGSTAFFSSPSAMPTDFTPAATSSEPEPSSSPTYE